MGVGCVMDKLAIANVHTSMSDIGVTPAKE
jgi:hypothetical protein